MPGSGLNNVLLLGDGTEVSMEFFKKAFEKPEYMVEFKHFVQNSSHKTASRLHAVNLTLKENIASAVKHKTDYKAVLQDILDGQSRKTSGCGLAKVAAIRFMINASHPAIRRREPFARLDFLASEQALATPAEYLNNPIHRLLVEVHVYGFVWEANLSKTYYATQAVLALGRLSIAVAGAVMSGGASAASLVDSIREAGKVTRDIVKLAGEAKNIVSEVQALADDHIMPTVEALRDVKAAGSGLKAARSGAGHAILGGPGDGPLDLSVAMRVDDSKRRPSFFERFVPTLYDSKKEAQKAQRKAQAEREQEIRKIHFLAVQQITPVIQIHDELEVSSEQQDFMSFKLKTFMTKRGFVRVGETNRDQFNQMVMVTKSNSFHSDSAIELLCRPWSSPNMLLSYLNSKHSGVTEFPEGLSSRFCKWDPDAQGEWELIDEQASTMPLPETLKRARVRLQQQAQAQAQLAEQRKRMIEGQQRLFLERARTKVQATAARTAALQAQQATQAAQREAELRQQAQAMVQSLMSDRQHQGGLLQQQMLASTQHEALARERQDSVTRLQESLQGQERQRREDELRRYAQVAQSRLLPTAKEFKEATTTRTAFITNKRKNMNLLLIDSALMNWENVQKASTSKVRSSEEISGALRLIQESCMAYMAEKQASAKASGSGVSERYMPVLKVWRAADTLIKMLE